MIVFTFKFPNMKTRKINLIFVILIVFMSIGIDGYTQKKALSIEEYTKWRSITSASISENGNWVCYAYKTPQKDDTLYVKNLVNDSLLVIPRGSSPKFSDNEKWLSYFLNISEKKAKSLKKEKKPVPKKAVLLNLISGENFKVENAASFSFSKGSGFFTVKKTKSDPKAKNKGTDLLIRNLNSGLNELIGSVSQFSINKPGTFLAYTIDVADTTGNGLYLIDLSSGIRTPLDTDRKVYEKLSWDKEGGALAVLKGLTEKNKIERSNILTGFYNIGKKDQNSFIYDPDTDSLFPKDSVICEKGNLLWAKDYSRIFFGIKEQSDKPPKKAKDADPLPDVDIWHWKDEKIQSVQMKQATRDKNFTYRSAYMINEKKFVRLCDTKMRDIEISENGIWGVGKDKKAYISDWKPSLADCYIVNTGTGERKQILKAHNRTLGLSPDNKNYLYWKDGNVWVYKIEKETKLNLTKEAGLSFENVEYDRPGELPPYGVSGWTKNGNSVILRHEFDLWLQPLDGSKAVNLTNGYGAENKIILRYIKTDPEEKFIDLKKPILLSAFGKFTKNAGFYELKKGKLTELVYEDKRYGRLKKAKKIDKFLYTIETCVDFPNYYVSDRSMKTPIILTDANPWQKDYIWANRILIDFKNKNGKKLQGILTIPETYKKGDKLPMHVNYYEKNSNNLNRYSGPRRSGSPNQAGMVSNGYLFMQPDIHFNTKTTHSDMLDCVEAAVKKVIEMGYADPDKISLHGHSFSGQGSAFISTRSKMFAAVVYGAGATNLVSDFNQLWKSSGTNQHRYDYYGQGRFGTNPYDDFDLYRNESAITHVRSMNTPLLILHGTADGSVEWLQAVEFYNALRFNGKNVILLSYPGAGHGLRKPENQKDFQLRTRQFLDHYLKSEDAPKWMLEGIPFLKKKK